VIDVDPKTSWPPKPYQPAQRVMAEHDAWWSGDPNRLANVYSDSGATTHPSSGERRFRFWSKKGEPATRLRLHIPLPADIATTSADLLFSDPPDIAWPDTLNEETVAAVSLLTEGLHPQLLEAAELAAALSGVYPRVVWDDQAFGHPMFDFVHADAAVPEWRWGQLAAVTFWRRLDCTDAKVWRYLERYEPGKISYGLYVGDEHHLGHRTPFHEHPDTMWLTTTIGINADSERVLDGPLAKRMLAWYVPNIRPNRRQRAMPLGRSDFQGIEGIFDALDETWTSWMRDLRLGRSRIIVPSEYVRSLGKGQGATFDIDQEVFVGLDGLAPDDAGKTITENQFTIRVDEHARTAAALVERAVAAAGYAGRTFGITGGDQPGAATATEVHASERKSFITRTKKSNYWTAVLPDMIETWLIVHQTMFAAKITPQRPRVTFPDGVEEQPLTVAQTVQALRTAEAASTDTLVRMVNPEWDEPAVDAEVAKILTEAGRQVPDPTDPSDPNTNLP
jgi:hypothetical protein